MSVLLDLTAAAPELMDAVICMDNSPAYEAFKEEIEAILKDFSDTGHLSKSWTIDEKDLTAKSEETLKNMQRAYLIWSFKEEKNGAYDKDCCCHTLVRLFYKSQEDVIKALLGGSDRVDSTDVKPLIDGFKAEIGRNPAVYKSVKDFFKGYVYGYYFNYLKEAQIMKKYAEMLAYLGVMSNKISTSISEQQKILPKMAMLLPNDRFKYLNGFVPRDLMMSIIFDRLELSPLSEGETAVLKAHITEYIKENYRTDTEDDVELISDDVSSAFFSKYFETYISTADFSEDLYQRSCAGNRIFLCGDTDDTGDFSAESIDRLTSAKCRIDHNTFYTTEKPPVNDGSIEGNDLCYKYPVIFFDKDSGYWFAPVYKELIFPVLDRDMYVPAEVPTGIFPFADEIFRSNPVRAVSGDSRLDSGSVTIRRDKIAVLDKLKQLRTASLSEKERKALMLEQTLVLMSGNMNGDDFNKCAIANVFDQPLYDEYISYRMDLLAGGVLDNYNAKKSLLDKLNKAMAE